jgi:hypothetical protein
LTRRSIEGRLSERNLREMPADLFDAMASLSHLHLGTHQDLAQLPRFDGIGHLKALSLVLLLSLRSLPDMSALARVKDVELLMLPVLDTLPALAMDAYPNLFLVQRSRVCCNGLLGACDPANAACRDLAAAECPEPASPPSGSLARVLASRAASVCSWEEKFGAVPVTAGFATPTRAAVDQCGGVLFRQCALAGSDAPPGQALCFNSRLMAVACVVSPDVIRLRMAEIRARAGQPCDPRHEAWLGCSTSSPRT